MLNFGDKLSELFCSSDIKAAEVCRKIDLNKSYLSKMKSGTMIPKDCGIVRDIANAMNLNNDETTQLCEAYKKDRFEEKYIDIEKSLKKIFSIYEYKNDVAENSKFPDIKLINGTIIYGTGNVNNAVHIMISNSKAYTNAILSGYNTEIFTVINQSLLQKENSFEFRQLIYLDENKYELNVRLFSEILPTVLSGKVFIKYLHENIEALYHYSLFPFILVNEKELLLIKSDYSAAMYMDTANAVKEYSNYFTEKFESSMESCLMFKNIGSFINGCSDIFTESEKNIPVDFYVIKRNPCVMLEGTSSIVEEHVCDESIDDHFVENYMDFLVKNTIENVKKYNILFSQKGLDEYFCKDPYYEYNKFIDRPVSYELRKNAYKKFFNSSQRNDVIQVNILEDSFFQNPRHCANIWSDGKLLLILNFEDCYRIIVLREKNIVSEIIKYFESLKVYKFALSKKETLEIMDSKLKKFDP